MNILVNELIENNVNDKIKESEEIICPICDENNIFRIKDYKISMECKNNHKYVDLSIKDFINSQKIDISKYKCNICNINNKSNTYGNEMYKCLNCDKLLCPLCKNKHNKKDKIINIEKKNVYCKKHYESFNNYCELCKKNICMRCEKEHDVHKLISYGKIMADDYNENEFDEYLDKLNNEINDIIKRLNEIKENIKLYAYKSKNAIKKNENRNYEILNGINEFINYNNKIINDIKEIINENDISKKFQYLMKIYSQMNKEEKNKIINKYNNYISSEIIIKKGDIKKK